MPAPGNYNDFGIMLKVDPNTLFGYATADMPAEAESIAGSIGNIVNIWNDLKLGWAGTSADEAQDFSNRWNAAITKLFGTEDDPESGAFPKIARAVGYAAINFGETEDVVAKMFASLSEGLAAPPGTPQPPTRDEHDGPVTESTPPW